ncbi:MAG: hypothetical protein A3H95_16815 [Acidobacteria bacterium RIFCSPLOWO2_02_FULL_64_15]|nr:MAG: hypothetical protein A3H95_16815 [Acidobacteria bacterium RIFCSPLOWO2_02_FULL_64_15]
MLVGEGGEPEYVSITPKSKMGGGRFVGSVASGHEDEVHQEIVGLRSDMRLLRHILPKAIKAAMQQQA